MVNIVLDIEHQGIELKKISYKELTKLRLSKVNEVKSIDKEIKQRCNSIPSSTIGNGNYKGE